MTAYRNRVGGAPAVRLELLDAKQDLTRPRRLKMMHPALHHALASAHIDDLHRAAARKRTIGLAHRARHEPRVAATSTSTQRSASESEAWTSSEPAPGVTPTETAQAAPWPCQSIVDVPSGPRAGIDLASRSS